MEIISYDYDTVKNDLLRAIDIIDRSSNLEEATSAFIGLKMFSMDIELVSELSCINSKLKSMSKTSKMIEVNNNLNSYYKQFDKRASEQIDYYIQLFSNNFKILDESLSNSATNATNYTPLTDDEIYNIIYHYLKNNDVQMLESFDKYISSGNIFRMILPICNGYTLSSPIFSKTYIEIQRKHNFEDLITIFHELSHAVVLDDFFKGRSYKEFNALISTNTYVEVYPRLRERLLLKFLFDNNLYTTDVKNYITKYLYFMKKVLSRNIENCKNNHVDFVEVKDIMGFLYRNVLFYNNFDVRNAENMGHTLDEKFYEKFSINDIEDANKHEIKKVLQM